MKNIFNTIIASAGTMLAFLVGDYEFALIALLIFLVLDYITGVACAYVNKTLSSAEGFKGLFKKMSCLIMIIVAAFVDRMVGTEWVVRNIVCYFYVANEGLSIVENAGQLGLPIPAKLKEVLAQLTDTTEVVSEGE